METLNWSPNYRRERKQRKKPDGRVANIQSSGLSFVLNQNSAYIYPRRRTLENLTIDRLCSIRSDG